MSTFAGAHPISPSPTSLSMQGAYLRANSSIEDAFDNVEATPLSHKPVRSYGSSDTLNKKAAIKSIKVNLVEHMALLPPHGPYTQHSSAKHAHKILAAHPHATKQDIVADAAAALSRHAKAAAAVAPSVDLYSLKVWPGTIIESPIQNIVKQALPIASRERGKVLEASTQTISIKDFKSSVVAKLADKELDDLLDVLTQAPQTAYWRQGRPSILLRGRPLALFAEDWQRYLKGLVWRTGNVTNGGTALLLNVLTEKNSQAACRLLARRPAELSLSLGTSLPGLYSLNVIGTAFEVSLPLCLKAPEPSALQTQQRLFALCMMMQSYIKEHACADIFKVQSLTRDLLGVAQKHELTSDPAQLGLLVGTAFAAAHRYASHDIKDVQAKWDNYASIAVLIALSGSGLLGFIDAVSPYARVIGFAATIIIVAAQQALKITDNSEQLLQRRADLQWHLKEDPNLQQFFAAEQSEVFYRHQTMALQSCGVFS